MEYLQKVKMQQKLYIIIIILAYLFLIQPIFGQSKVLFDVKTKRAEKMDLLPIKTATVILLLKSDWASVVEIGEDYSLWLKEYERKKVGDIISVKFCVELRTPAMLRSGSLLQSEKIEFSFKSIDEWNEVTTVREAIKQELKNFSGEIQTEAILGGEKVVNIIIKMVNRL